MGGAKIFTLLLQTETKVADSAAPSFVPFLDIFMSLVV